MGFFYDEKLLSANPCVRKVRAQGGQVQAFVDNRIQAEAL